jgi:small subunit ribosomal protein S1
VHISELAQHHVENPREIVAQGQPVNVKIIEVDGERRRLSLSLKRVEDTDVVQPRADGAESVHTRPNLDLSEDVFADAPETIEGEADELEPPYDLPPAADETPSVEAAATDAVVAPEEEAPVEEAAQVEDAAPVEEAAAEEAPVEDAPPEAAAEPVVEEADAAPTADPEASSPEE